MIHKILPTVYNGVRFRSRTEARWAVYFDLERIAWEYEPEGYQLGAICYLPDFYLPQVRMFAEVKPAGGFDFPALRKCAALVKATGRPCLLLNGPPAPRPFWGITPDYMRPNRLWANDYAVNSYCNYHIDEARFWGSCAEGAALYGEKSARMANGYRFWEVSHAG